MTTPKQAYDARRELKRIARGDRPDTQRDEELMQDLLLDMAERFVVAIEGIEMNLRRNQP